MKRSGFTILEAVVVVGILIILAAILFPVFVRPKGHSSRRHHCQSNFKPIGLGFAQYVQDYDGKYPIAKNSKSGLSKNDNWIGQLMPYLKSEQMFLCPSDENAKQGQSSYAYNEQMSRVVDKKLKHSAVVILNFEVVADANSWTQTGTGPQAVSAKTRHQEGANYSFADGHVKWLKPEDVGALPPSKEKYTFVPG